MEEDLNIEDVCEYDENDDEEGLNTEVSGGCEEMQPDSDGER